jgi:outer membrane protein assembly factor BamB
MPRWLVTLALFLVTNPADAERLRVHLDSVRTTTTATLPQIAGPRDAARVQLAAGLVAIDEDDTLTIIDTTTGTTIATTPVAGGIAAIARAPSGDIYIKTQADLVALTPAGAVRWVRPATANSNVAVTPRAVIDGWVDRDRHRFGIVSYDPVDGHVLARTELGPTGGWYDHDRMVLAPDGPNEVLVSTAFGVE